LYFVRYPQKEEFCCSCIYYVTEVVSVFVRFVRLFIENSL
jgi:hypothetical protein